MTIKQILQSFRTEINNLDLAILDNLEQRFNIVHQVTAVKSSSFPSGFLYIDPAREYELMRRNMAYALDLGIPQNTIRVIWRAIIAYANLMEQPGLKIYIPKNLNFSELNEVTAHYPIKHAYCYYQNLQHIALTDGVIIVMDLSNLNDIEVCEYLMQNHINLYHMQESESGGKVGFFGKIYQLYSQDDGINVLFDREREMVKFTQIGKIYLNNSDVKIGTSSPLI